MNTYFSARVLADSISPAGVRLTTLEVTLPRFLLAEFNTHRVFSRNSASSRAIPPEKLIEAVENHPFVPETFNRRVKGMGVGAELSAGNQEAARYAWLRARDQAVASAKALLVLDVDKSRINRLLEPFMWHTVIVTATEWDNFFELRCPPGDEPDIEFPAQVEFQRAAILMREAMASSEPIERDLGVSWHLPLVSDEERGRCNSTGTWHYWAMVSAGRCARVSYDTHENWESTDDSYKRAERLASARHFSPFEHQASPMVGWDAEYTWSGNFRGWNQFRKRLPNESGAE